MKYLQYPRYTVDIILDDPREISKDPIMLATSFLLNNIKEVVEENYEYDETKMWEKTLPLRIYNSIVKSSIEDFVSAGENGTAISINGQSFSIRKWNSVNPDELINILQFPQQGDEVVIVREGVFNIKTPTQESIQEKREEWKRRRDYHRKVLMLGKNDDGWDKLTDIEVAMYCWAQYIKKIKPAVHVSIDDITEWHTKWKDYFYLPLKEVMSCFIDDALDNENYNVRAIFNVDKVIAWNTKNQQPSAISTITDEQVDYWWYNEGWEKYPII